MSVLVLAITLACWILLPIHHTMHDYCYPCYHRVAKDYNILLLLLNVGQTMSQDRWNYCVVDTILCLDWASLASTPIHPHTPHNFYLAKLSVVTYSFFFFFLPNLGSNYKKSASFSDSHQPFIFTHFRQDDMLILIPLGRNDSQLSGYKNAFKTNCLYSETILNTIVYFPFRNFRKTIAERIFKSDCSLWPNSE